MDFPENETDDFLGYFPENLHQSIRECAKTTFEGRLTRFETEAQKNKKVLTFSFSPILSEKGTIDSLSLVIEKDSGIINEVEHQLRNVIEHSSLAIFLGKPSGEIVDMNKTACKIFGYSPKEFQELGRSGIFLENEEFLDGLKIRAEKGEVESELTGIRKNGEHFPCEVHSVVYKDHRGELRTSTGVLDISEKKKQEQRAANNRKAFESLFHHNPDAVYAFDLEGKFIRVNQSSLNLIEKTEEELLNSSFIPFIDERDVQKVLQHSRKTAKGEIQHYKTHFIGAQGTKRVLAVTNFPIYVNEEITGVYGIAKDITEQVKAEKMLREERNMLKAIIDNIPDYIFVKDLEHRSILANRKFHQNFLNVNSEEEALGLTPLDYFEETKARELIEDNERVTKSGESVINREDVVINKDGSRETVLLTKVPLTDREGNITGLVGIARNITSLKEQKIELERLNEELEERAKELSVSNQELEQFAYIASHDLQEPLRMITGFLDRLKLKYEDQLDDKALQYIDIAHDGALRMRQLILDLLKFSRAGRLEHKLQKIDLNQLLDGILNLQQETIRETKARVIFSELPVIIAEKTPLRQVLTNLIGNALKYQAPEVIPEVEIKVQEKDKHWLFQISDNGIGIEKEFHQKIFVIFKRLHSRQHYSGTGLGLAICKKIVENMGGEIWVESKPGIGSSFYFTISK
ncbi:MAG TPA: PAS domain S-box protein [Salegentibacter sp.]|uniref:PAS domain-containing sensor histidine kinase n=1 Tax=Salegentibacter sp. TaxID=1903072 RepID=UPI002F93B475